MQYDVEDEIRVIYNAQRGILFASLQIDDAKTEFPKKDAALETENAFAEDAGEFTT